MKRRDGSLKCGRQSTFLALKDDKTRAELDDRCDNWASSRMSDTIRIPGDESKVHASA
jgi:hypothetical protein